jgi:two-component system NtrC family sensor kinase
MAQSVAEQSILVVDDTPANLSLIAGLLNDQYRVRAATSGAKALELAAANPPDLILLDIMMPEMDGIEVCRRLKAMEATRDTPVIFLTAKSEEEEGERGFTAGAVDFVRKPINPPVLLARVKTHLQNKQWQDYLRSQNTWLEREVARRMEEIDRLRERERESERQKLEAVEHEVELRTRELRATQQQLVVREKMASLGQLTAGIAHEIRNPLNFINNFAKLSGDLLKDMREIAAPARAALDANNGAEFDDIVKTLHDNLHRITEHGQRADSIVHGMLMHSRSDAGERRARDLNKLVDEALNLAYYGYRARHKGLTVNFERNFAAGMAPFEAAQDLSRIFLNLFGNAFYAMQQRARGAGAEYAPLLNISTRAADGAHEVIIRDNGTGVPLAIIDKLFTPFFTTKPPGEGTGLGLSLSYDIVVNAYGGELSVTSVENEFTEFKVRLPGSQHAVPARENFNVRDCTFAPLRSFVETCCAKAGMPARTVSMLVLVIEELYANSLHHGYPGLDVAVAQWPVWISLTPGADGVDAVYEDEGVAFNPLEKVAAPDYSGPAESWRVGGLGMPMVTELADNLRYERIDGRNRLSFTLKNPEIESLT